MDSRERPRALGRRLLESSRAIAVLLSAAILALIAANAWVAEDAFISFRSVEQLVAGDGPRWNPHERVQTFTHPLWFGFLVLGRLAVGDLYWASLILNLLCVAAALGVIFRATRWDPRQMVWIAALLVSGKAWVDYATSGLENALSYLLLAGFFATAAPLADPAQRRSPGRLLAALTLVSLLAVNRLDSLALTLPAALWLVWRARSSLGIARALTISAAASLPLLLWTIYSVVYFGFPVPNTAYAKLNTGIPQGQLAAQGLWYLWNSLRWDPIALVTLVWAAVLAWTARDRSGLWRAVSVGLLLHCLYILRIGGDFMSGRFLSVAYLAAVLLFVARAGPRGRLAMGALLVMLLISPSHPLRFTDFDARIDAHQIADERSYYASGSSLQTCLRRRASGLDCPDHEWVREGREFRLSGRRIEIRKAIGMFGYAAGRDQIIIDSLALADPLLARLPVDGSHRVGHYWRRVPDGYAATVLTGRNQIQDPGLGEWYEHMRLITQGPLFSRERWVTILEMNVGAFDPLLREYSPPSH